MSLEKNSFIQVEDFNNLKDSIRNEILRRGKKTDFFGEGENNDLGNDNNRNPFTSSSITLEEQSQYNVITEQYFQKILNFFKNFYYNNPTKYPGELASSYTDDDIDIGDIIYALEQLSTFLSTLQTTSTSHRVSNNDCRNGNCMGLCTNNCHDGCTNCTGTCSGDCLTGCGNECQRGCGGTCNGSCGDCTGSCSGGCGNACYRGCGGCGTTCTEECGESCRGGCSSGCDGGCKGACGNACSTNCMLSEGLS